MNLDVVFLGTAGSSPTAQRGVSATVLRRGGERILVDCGEGTQRQLLRSDVGLVDFEDVLLTHLHADHFLGLPGMLKTFALRGRELPLTVYGPRGTRGLVDRLRGIFGRIGYALEVVELEPGESLPRGDYRLEAIGVAHGGGALGYALREHERPGRFAVEVADRLGVPEGPQRGALQRGEAVTLTDGTLVQPTDVLGPPRPGRTVVLSGDTAPCSALIDAAQGADLLVHEATFLADERARARETDHSTAADAALAARAAGVRLLALTHLSARYGGREVEAEARELFGSVVVPRDFDVIDLPLPERGPPTHHPRGARVRRVGVPSE